jgi:hypothetical protein
MAPVNEFRFFHYGLGLRNCQDEEGVENMDKTDYNERKSEPRIARITRMKRR